MRDLLHEVPTEADAAHLARAFRDLGDPVRLRILSAVACGEAATVDELAVLLGRTDVSLRYHLNILLQGGLLSRGYRTPHRHAVDLGTLEQVAGLLGVFR